MKKAAVDGYGGRVVECEPTLDARERGGREWSRPRPGGTLIPPFDHPDVIAGQGTAALELLDDVPDLDAVVAPVGGGGLLAGFCVAARGEPGGPRVRGRAARRRRRGPLKAAGEWLPQTAPNTIADGLLTSLGELTWPIIRDQVERVFTVTEERDPSPRCGWCGSG